MTDLQNPTPRDKRIVKAHKKRYVENKDLTTIAEEMGYAYDTVRNYFRDDSVERIKQVYDEDELEFLKIQLFQEIKEAKNRANSYLGEAVSQDDVDAKEYIRAAKEEQRVPMRFVEALQQLGIIKKPKDRKEITKNKNDSGESLEKRLQSAYEKYNESEEQKKDEQNGEEVKEAGQ